MNKTRLHWDYNREADVLYISVASPAVSKQVARVIPNGVSL